MKDFKVGDTVICKTSFQGNPQKGWKGKVINVRNSYYQGCDRVGIEWEKSFGWGHSCSGFGKEGQCKYYYSDLSVAESSNLCSIYKYQEQLELF